MQKLLCFFLASSNELSSEPLCPSLKLAPAGWVSSFQSCSSQVHLWLPFSSLPRHLLSSTAIAAQLNEQAWILTSHMLAWKCLYACRLARGDDTSGRSVLHSALGSWIFKPSVLISLLHCDLDPIWMAPMHVRSYSSFSKPVFGIECLNIWIYKITYLWTFL